MSRKKTYCAAKSDMERVYYIVSWPLETDGKIEVWDETYFPNWCPLPVTFEEQNLEYESTSYNM
jgi:hypothetical protein